MRTSSVDALSLTWAVHVRPGFVFLADGCSLTVELLEMVSGVFGGSRDRRSTLMPLLSFRRCDGHSDDFRAVVDPPDVFRDMCGANIPPSAALACFYIVRGEPFSAGHCLTEA